MPFSDQRRLPRCCVSFNGIEIARKFGSVDMAEQIRQINDEADRRIASAGSDRERSRLESNRRSSVRDIEAMRDRIRGQYALPSNPDGLVMRANRVVRNLNYLRLLGGMTVSAIPDMGRIVFTHGLTSTFRDGFVPLVTNFRKFRLAAEEVKQAGTALDIAVDQGDVTTGIEQVVDVGRYLFRFHETYRRSPFLREG